MRSTSPSWILRMVMEWGGGNPFRFGQRFDRYKRQITPNAATEINPQGRDVVRKVRPYNRWGGWFNRYKPILGQQSEKVEASGQQPLERQVRQIQDRQSTMRGGGRFERYAHDTQEKVRYGSIDWDVAPQQDYFDELFRISRNQIIWGGNYFSLPPTRCFVVWRKRSISERFSMAMAEYAWTSFNDNAKVFECIPHRGAHSGRFHPTEKPIELYQWLLRTFAHEGDTIIDTHMGSQASRLAAWSLDFDYVGCEINEYYFTCGCEWFNRETQQSIPAGSGCSHGLRQLTLF